MSSVFMTEVVPWCKLTDERLEQLKAIIAGLDHDDFVPDDYDESEEYQAAMTEAMDAYRNWPKMPDDFPVSWQQIGGTGWCITAAWSHGDIYPTEACKHFGHIRKCEPVYRALRQWAIEDATGTRNGGVE